MSWKEEVLQKVSIPMYFYNIIIPNMQDYYNGDYIVDFEADLRAKCPLHDENTPSFRYYPETNSWYCWGGCGGGNIITLHKMFTKRLNERDITTDEAVAFLYKYFIEGKETTKIVIDETKKEHLNEPSSLIKLNLYRKNLELSITSDNTLKEDVKRKLWKELDNIDILISLDLVTAESAEKYLKDKVKDTITLEATEQTKQRFNVKPINPTKLGSAYKITEQV